MKNTLLIIVLAAVCFACSKKDPTVRHWKNSNIIDVSSKIKPIPIEDDVIISNLTDAYFIGDYFLIADFQSYDYYIHLFDRNSFKYITSTCMRGPGPGEITRIGEIGIDEENNRFFVNDHGKEKIFTYYIDSVLKDPDVIPELKLKMSLSLFPTRYKFINDTLSIAQIIMPTSVSSFQMLAGKLNLKTGEITKMPYQHKDIELKRISLDVDKKREIYAEAYATYDLITVCGFDGSLKYNIYGPKWGEKLSNTSYFDDIVFCKDKILAPYNGAKRITTDSKGNPQSVIAKIIIVFNNKGEYIKTLDLKKEISTIVYDERNNRILISFCDENDYFYLDLDGLV